MKRKEQTVEKDKSTVSQHKRLFDGLFVFTALLLSATFCLGWLTARGEVFSPVENRILAGPPRLTAASLLSGEFFSELVEFCSDRAPFRLSLIRLKTACELTLGKGQSNNVLFLPHGRLAHRGEYHSLELLCENLDRLAELKRTTSALCVTVPRSIDIYSPFASESAARVSSAVNEKLGSHPVGSLLSDISEQERIYYKTDHHLDRDGAYAVYRHIVCDLGETPYEKEAFQWQTVTESFLGSAYSDGGAVSILSDRIDLPRYEGDEKYTVTCLDGCGQSKLYSFNALEAKDKYSVFLGGNHGILSICLEGESRPHILLVKDSFANAVVPMLLRHFNVTVYDPRYTAERLTVKKEDRIVVLCGVDTLATTAFRPRLEFN